MDFIRIFAANLSLAVITSFLLQILLSRLESLAFRYAKSKGSFLKLPL